MYIYIRIFNFNCLFSKVYYKRYNKSKEYTSKWVIKDFNDQRPEIHNHII